jgi:hypothetical protein
MPVVTVPAGQTLAQLAARYYGSAAEWGRIAAANPELAPGPQLPLSAQRLVIPAAPDGTADTALALLLAGLLISAPSADALLADVGVRFVQADLPLDAVEIALRIVMSFPMDRMGASGPATREMIRVNLMRRAQFAVASARRLAADVRGAKSRNESLLQALNAGRTREQRYFAQHVMAIWNRMDAAAKVDSAAGIYGDLLGWNTVMDRRTSAECRAANHRNFLADHMPSIGYPGMVHPHCRCYPGRPYPGAALLPARAGVLSAA